MATNLTGGTLNGLTRTLDLRLRQHGLASSNLANTNTPGFRARRIDFEAAFETVFASQDALPMQKTMAGHIGGQDDPDAASAVIEAPAWSEDGNSVNADHEMGEMAVNNVLFNATVEAISRKLAILEYAASDGGRG